MQTQNRTRDPHEPGDPEVTRRLIAYFDVAPTTPMPQVIRDHFARKDVHEHVLKLVLLSPDPRTHPLFGVFGER